jgi:phosphodiester glycosidase
MVSQTITTLAPGLTLTRIKLSSGPVRISVLRVNLAKAVMVDTTLSAPSFGTYATVSDMAQANGAIAAINGDFGLWRPLRPMHSFSDDGTLATTGWYDSSFSVSQDETRARTGKVRVGISGLVSGSTTPFAVARWNTETPDAGEIDGYDPTGGSSAPPPSSGCFARLAPSGGMGWGVRKVGVTRSYIVSAVSCQSSRMALNGDVVLASRSSGTGATTIRSLSPGTTLSLTWKLNSWPDVTTSIGGGPMLVRGGRVVAPNGCGSLCDLNPRTGVGITKTGTILLVTVDGRNPGWSIGMTLTDFAKEMIRLGAVRAMNLDGGGSTTLWTKRFGLVNRPTDCLPKICERDVSSAVLVLPSTEKEATIAAPSGPVMAANARQTGGDTNTGGLDPGSIGGYLDALTRGALGRVGAMPPSFLRAAAAFRASTAR